MSSKHLKKCSNSYITKGNANLNFKISLSTEKTNKHMTVYVDKVHCKEKDIIKYYLMKYELENNMVSVMKISKSHSSTKYFHF